MAAPRGCSHALTLAASAPECRRHNTRLRPRLILEAHRFWLFCRIASGTAGTRQSPTTAEGLAKETVFAARRRTRTRIRRPKEAEQRRSNLPALLRPPKMR